jgi:hypothetical protein
MIRNIYNHTIGRWQIRKELIVNNKEVSISSLKPRHELLLIRTIFSQLLVLETDTDVVPLKLKLASIAFFLAIIFMVFNYISNLKRLYYRLMELTRYTSNIKDRTD